jgi:hypothetical protein
MKPGLPIAGLEQRTVLKKDLAPVGNVRASQVRGIAVDPRWEIAIVLAEIDYPVAQAFICMVYDGTTHHAIFSMRVSGSDGVQPIRRRQAVFLDNRNNVSARDLGAPQSQIRNGLPYRLVDHSHPAVCSFQSLRVRVIPAGNYYDLIASLRGLRFQRR